MSENTQATQKNESLKLIKKDTVEKAEMAIREFVKNGELRIPANYSIENAMKSAWLILQDTKDMNKQPVLESCTKASIYNALLSMGTQALNPNKKQCYFIPYGGQLQCFRSYFGSIAVAKRCAGVRYVAAQVVHQGDVFEYIIKDGNKHVTKHEQKLENIDNEKIVAAYAVIKTECEDDDVTEIMTFNQIRKAWDMSKVGADKRKTHKDFAEEMSMRTVINRALKRFINTTDDSDLYAEAVSSEFDPEDMVEVDYKVDNPQTMETIDFEATTQPPTETTQNPTNATSPTNSTIDEDCEF